jgi:hypothetical protein
MGRRLAGSRALKDMPLNELVHAASHVRCSLKAFKQKRRISGVYCGPTSGPVLCRIGTQSCGSRL